MDDIIIEKYKVKSKDKKIITLINRLEEVINILENRSELYITINNSENFINIKTSISMCCCLIDALDSQTKEDFIFANARAFHNRELKSIILCIKRFKKEKKKDIVEMRGKVKKVLVDVMDELEVLRKKWKVGG